LVDDPVYDDFKIPVKERDGWRCVNGCPPRGPFDDDGHSKLLKVVRVDRWLPDSMDNLQTVCGGKGSKCVPHWES